jgi:hypothetical protein
MFKVYISICRDYDKFLITHSDGTSIHICGPTCHMQRKTASDVSARVEQASSYIALVSGVSCQLSISNELLLFLAHNSLTSAGLHVTWRSLVQHSNSIHVTDCLPQVIVSCVYKQTLRWFPSSKWYCVVLLMHSPIYTEHKLRSLADKAGEIGSEWLRHYATSQKVAGSRPDEVNTFFNLPNPCGCTRHWGLLSL